MLVDGVTSVTFLFMRNLITSSLLGLGPILMKYKGLYTSLVGEEWLEPKMFHTMESCWPKNLATKLPIMLTLDIY